MLLAGRQQGGCGRALGGSLSGLGRVVGVEFMLSYALSVTALGAVGFKYHLLNPERWIGHDRDKKTKSLDDTAHWCRAVLYVIGNK